MVVVKLKVAAWQAYGIDVGEVVAGDAEQPVETGQSKPAMLTSVEMGADLEAVQNC